MDVGLTEPADFSFSTETNYFFVCPLLAVL